MKNFIRIQVLFIVGLVIIHFNCAKPVYGNPAKDAAWEQRCKGVATLAWQTEIQGADAESTAKIVAGLTAAAKADAKQANASGTVDINLKSELARVINENISTSSKVDDDFWKQENTFGRLYCLSVSLLDRKDIKSDQKALIVNDVREMQKAEAEYMLGKQKKNQ